LRLKIGLLLWSGVAAASLADTANLLFNVGDSFDPFRLVVPLVQVPVVAFDVA